MNASDPPRSDRAHRGDDASQSKLQEEHEPDADAVVVIPTSGELDLHAFAPRDVPAVVEDYLDACRDAGVREVRLIHGRGKGVQRAVVRRVLARMQGIADVRDAPPGSGGWGATLLRLESVSPREPRENPGKPQ